MSLEFRLLSQQLHMISLGFRPPAFSKLPCVCSSPWSRHMAVWTRFDPTVLIAVLSCPTLSLALSVSLSRTRTFLRPASSLRPNITYTRPGRCGSHTSALDTPAKAGVFFALSRPRSASLLLVGSGRLVSCSRRKGNPFSTIGKLIRESVRDCK